MLLSAGNVVLAVTSVMLGVPVATAQNAPSILDPDWDRAFEQGIEWCAPVDGELTAAKLSAAEVATGRRQRSGRRLAGRRRPETPLCADGLRAAGRYTTSAADCKAPSLTLRALLLVCTKDARIDLVDLQTGRSRLDKPIQVQPGTLFAGSTGEVAYGFGASQVYAFSVSQAGQAKVAQPGLLWQTSAAPQAQTPVDPESMTRLVAAKATPAGVLIVRSDGRVAELNRDDGSVRWRHKLPKITNCTLHVRDQTAALLSKHGAALSVAFFDSKIGQPRPRVTRFEESPPIWSALIPDGLAMVWQQRFGVAHADGRVVIRGFPDHVRGSAKTVASYVPEPGPTQSRDAPGEARSAWLILPSRNGPLWAYDVLADCRVYFDADQAPNVDSGLRANSMRISGDFVLETSVTQGANVYRAADGARVASLTLHHAVAVDIGVHDGKVYALFADGRLADSERLPRNQGRVTLLTRPLPEPPGSRAHEKSASLARHFDVGRTSSVRETLWLGGRLVIVEDKRVRGYTLP